MMSPLPLSNHQDFNSLLVYPLGLCATTTVTTYVLSIITGNSSQVDRLWTFLPTIYTAYWALLPLWPHKSATWRNLVLVPYVPDEASHFARHFSPRALLILGLTVRILAPEYTCVTSTDTLQRFCGCAGYPIIPGDVAYSDCAFSWPLTHPTVFEVFLQERRGLPLGHPSHQNPALVIPNRQPHLHRYVRRPSTPRRHPSTCPPPFD
jgi:hypothetical protein